MGPVTVSPEPAHVASRRRGAVWLDDLRWHRHMFDQSRTRWTFEHALAVALSFTGGRTDFTTVADLRRLQQAQAELVEYGDQARLALAETLRAAQPVFGPRWGSALEAIGMTRLDWDILAWTTAGRMSLATNAEVARTVEGLPVPNPLTEAWELRQLWQMYEAATNILEDALCDLVVELTELRPAAVLLEATGEWAEYALLQRVEAARDARGGPRDPRRAVHQTYEPN